MQEGGGLMHALTYALAQPETARAALEALRGVQGPAVVEALVELLARPHTGALAPAAVELLARQDGPLVDDGLVQALDSPLATVRLAAVEALAGRQVHHVGLHLARLLREDESWPVRRAALRALAAHPGPLRQAILTAADDPHWRVRHALIGVLLEGGPEADGLLAGLAEHPRVEGVRAYLRFLRGEGELPAPAPAPAVPAFHDPDPAVLARNLEELGPAGRRQYLAEMPALLAHEDDRVRRLAVETLRRHGDVVHLAVAVAQLDDPRTGASSAVAELMCGVDRDRAEAVARYLLYRSDPSEGQLAWALDQAGVTFPVEEEAAICRRWLSALMPARCRSALARLAARWPELDASVWMPRFLTDPDPEVRREALASLRARPDVRIEVDPWLLTAADPLLRVEAVRSAAHDPTGLALLRTALEDPDARVRVSLAEGLLTHRAPEAKGYLARLQHDPHPLVRAAALTPDRARAILDAPERETSWHVRAEAARLCKLPLWQLQPRPAWDAPASAPVPAQTVDVRPGSPPHARPLGPGRILVAPLGLSGHYGLPVEGFVRAVEAGANLLFWEPNYQTLTQFSARLPGSLRCGMHFLAGTFEATPRQVGKDLERALRMLQIEQVAIFLLFWTRSWARLTDELRAALEAMRAEGKVGAVALSTHNRALAVEAIRGGWDPVMVRHSAAHRGAEAQVFPHAVAHATSVITFNSTCYGRLLRPRPGRPAPTATDCYRYSLAQPGVTVCLSAPATLAQLDENLQALHDPVLPEDRRRSLLEQGEEVYREETVFRRLVRSR